MEDIIYDRGAKLKTDSFQKHLEIIEVLALDGWQFFNAGESEGGYVLIVSIPVGVEMSDLYELLKTIPDIGLGVSDDSDSFDTGVMGVMGEA